MRVKTDYMGNDQLLPAYNVQLAVADEYIVAADVLQYRSDMDCFIPLMERFHRLYGFYPRYPVADAGYGSYNNYLYCEEHGMEKYMKFAMYEKEIKDETYRSDPFRAVNFQRDKDGDLICPNGKKFYLPIGDLSEETDTGGRKNTTPAKTVEDVHTPSGARRPIRTGRSG